MHVVIRYRGTIRAAVGFRTDKRSATYVASSFYNFNLRAFISEVARQQRWSQVGWLCDLRSGSDTMRTHDFQESDISQLLDPQPWQLDAQGKIAKFHGTKPGVDRVWDCGYCLFMLHI